jgi:hypothetical protein
MIKRKHVNRKPWRKFLLALTITGICGLGYLAWSPGTQIHDGRHDLGSNGIWLQHGWLGDDAWFKRNNRDKSNFRDAEKIKGLARLLARHGVKYLFPHLCPCNVDGEIATVDPIQTERFLDYFEGFSVIPWVGGVLNTHCFLKSRQWRTNFASSIANLLQTHPRLAGVQVNIEPLPTGNKEFLTLLAEIRSVMPKGKILSVAAYPPNTILHPFPNVHWEESYFRDVAQHCDQIAVMMYDTGISSSKLYQHLMSAWTEEVLNWSGGTHVLLGVPAYEDPDVGYHSPRVENLKNALLGIHAALIKYEHLPKNYSGIAIYCEWEMDQEKWNLLKSEYEKNG